MTRHQAELSDEENNRLLAIVVAFQSAMRDRLVEELDLCEDCILSVMLQSASIRRDMLRQARVERNENPLN